jgi:hypothetical protein
MSAAYTQVGAVCGMPAVGNMLEVSPANFASTTSALDSFINEEVPSATQWMRNGTAIPGATSRFYTLTNDDIGAVIGASVTYINFAGGAHSFDVLTIGPILASVGVPELLSPVGMKTFSGGPIQVGAFLQAVPSVWTWDNSQTRLYPLLRDYQWFRNGVEVANGFSFSFTPSVPGTYTVRERIRQIIATGYAVSTGFATSATSNTLTNVGASWAINQWSGQQIRITAGTGLGQSRNIASNTATVATVSPAWTVIPDATSSYSIERRNAPTTLSTVYSTVSDFASITGAIDSELVYADTLQYLGAFRLPIASGANPLNWSGSDGLGAPGTVVWYNEEGDGGAGSLLIGGRSGNNASWLAEVSIPATLEPTGNTTNLNSNPAHRGVFLSPEPRFFDMSGGQSALTSPGDINGVVSGGVYMHGGNIYQNWGRLYQSGSDPTHFRKTGTALDSGTITGPFAFASVPLPDGYVTIPLWYRGPNALIPAAWQTALNGSMLQAQTQYSNQVPMGFGPALFSFNPAHVGTVSPVPNNLLLAYTTENPIEQLISGQRPDFWVRGASQVSGVAFPSGSRSVLMTYRGNNGPVTYGSPGEFDEQGSGLFIYNPASTNKGYHAYPNTPRLLAYDANDLKDVRDGARLSHTLKPYAAWDLVFPGAPPESVEFSKGHTSMAYDDAGKRLFIFERETSRSTSQPICHVYRVNL